MMPPGGLWTVRRFRLTGPYVAGCYGNTPAHTWDRSGAAGLVGPEFRRDVSGDRRRSELWRVHPQPLRASRQYPLATGAEPNRNQPAKQAQSDQLQVQQSRIGLIQGKAQVEAAREAVRLAQESRDAEQEKLRVGLSTAYNVILKERDLVSAQYAAVQVQGAYANALVAMDQATGTTLEHNGIRLDDALTGIVTTPRPRPTRPPGSDSARNEGNDAVRLEMFVRRSSRAADAERGVRARGAGCSLVKLRRTERLRCRITARAAKVFPRV